MFYDGQHVSYVGLDPQRIGDRGRVLQAEAHGAHVLWISGALNNQVVYTDGMDMAPLSRVSNHQDGLEDSLEVGEYTAHTAVRVAYDDGGEVGVLNYMAEQGYLAAFASIADETLSFVASRIRQDPGFAVVAAQLDDDEAADLVRLAAAVLMRDAFTED